jgi:hypothetical protein
MSAAGTGVIFPTQTMPKIPLIFVFCGMSAELEQKQ